MDGLLVLRIFRDDEHRCTSLEVVGGPKRYLRVWDGLDRHEWGWVLNDAARLIADFEREKV